MDNQQINTLQADGQQTKEPLISVIVPIYNVEKYVRKCLDSLKGQSLKQIEVICIDDGSTDNSGKIADEYITEFGVWPEFRIVHHKKNRGLSAARNTGIDESQAEWLMFVDSDDWVDPEFCRVPYESAIEKKADMAIFYAYPATEKGYVRRGKPRKNITGLIDHETAIDVGGLPVWNRIYRKTLFEVIRYPEGCLHEDCAITHRLVYRTERIISIDKKLYYYRYRKGSISRSDAGNKEWLFISKTRFLELISLGYPEDKAKIQLIGAALRYCGKTKSIDNPEYQEAIKILKSIEGIPDGLSKKNRMELLIWSINKKMYNMIYRGYSYLR